MARGSNIVGTSPGTPSHGVVVPIVNGTPGSPVAVSGTGELYGMACPTVTTCEAVGTNSLNQGVVVPIINGTPGSAQVVPGTVYFNSVACPSASTCEAAGWSKTGGS